MDKNKAGESGYTLVVVAGVLVILLGFAALSVDVGILYAAHTAAQRAADAAALAGAYAFIEGGPLATPAGLIAQATTNATDTAIQNTILGTTITAAELTPAIVVDEPNRRVTVSLSHTIPTFFAGVLGQKFVTVSVVAVAEAGTDPNCAGCIKPWFIPNTVLADNGCNACTSSPKQLLIEANATAPTPWALTQLNQPFILHAANKGDALAPGDYFSIILDNDVDEDPPPGFNGASVYKDNIASCREALSIDCSRAFNVKTGKMVGPTKFGTALFISFGITDNPNQLDHYRDSWNTVTDGIPSYIGPADPWEPAISGIKKTSHQVAVAPIMDVCSQACPGGPTNPPTKPELPTGGNVMVSVIGYAQIFIADVASNSEVTAYLVSVAGCGAAPQACGGSSVMGYPLRLVRMN